MVPIDLLVVNHTRPVVEQALAGNFTLHHVLGDGLAVRSLAAIAPGLRGLLTGVPPVPITRELIDALPNLEIIANFGAGYDAVDMAAACARGVMVTHTPGVVNEDVADLAVGLMLATIRRLPQAWQFVTAGQWSDREFPMSPSLQGRRIGLFGMGGIGRAIARRCEGFGVEVIYYARRVVPDLPYRYVPDLLSLGQESDVLICAVPGGDATRGVIDDRVLDALGPNGVLVNISRGSVVDEAALIRVLARGGLLAAGLDVFADEPHVPDALASRDDVVVLPHIAGATDANRDRIGLLQARNIRSWFDGAGAITPTPEMRGSQ